LCFPIFHPAFLLNLFFLTGSLFPLTVLPFFLSTSTLSVCPHLDYFPPPLSVRALFPWFPLQGLSPSFPFLLPGRSAYEPQISLGSVSSWPALSLASTMRVGPLIKFYLWRILLCLFSRSSLVEVDEFVAVATIFNVMSDTASSECPCFCDFLTLYLRSVSLFMPGDELFLSDHPPASSSYRFRSV